MNMTVKSFPEYVTAMTHISSCLQSSNAGSNVDFSVGNGDSDEIYCSSVYLPDGWMNGILVPITCRDVVQGNKIRVSDNFNRFCSLRNVFFLLLIVDFK